MRFLLRLLIVYSLLFPQAKIFALDYYWVGGSGLWSDHNNHWAKTSGGFDFHDQVPTSMDNVFFDANSFPAGGTVTIDQTIIYCMDMDWTGSTNSPTLEGPSDRQLWIYGSIKLIADISWVVLGEVHFRSFVTGNTITTAGQEFYYVNFDGQGGSWKLMDAFRVNTYLYHTEGTLHTNDQNLEAGYYFWSSGSPNRKLHFGNSNIYIGYNHSQSNFFVFGENPHIIDAGTSTIHITGTAGATNYFFGGNQTYHKIKCEIPTQLVGDNNFYDPTFFHNAFIEGNNHFDNLTLMQGQVYQLAGGTTQTINPGGSFNGNGSCMDYLAIISTSAGIAAKIEKTTGSIVLNYAVLQDIQGIGGAIFNANNSVDLGNNAGWTFPPLNSRNLYWVGGGGDWNDVAHWSLMSGGLGGECIPTPFDNVYFDQNSGFSAPTEHVNINIPIAFCQSMNWSGVLNSPELKEDYKSKLYIFGSLNFISNMTTTLYGEVHFMAHTLGNTITTAGQEFYYVNFDGQGGSWKLMDAFRVNTYLYHTEGTLHTNDQNLEAGYYFWSSGSPNRKLHFGNSNIYIGYNHSQSNFFVFGENPHIIDAGTSTIHITGTAGATNYFFGGNQTYHKIKCEIPTQLVGDNNFYDATFFHNAFIEGNNHFELLTFSPGNRYELYPNSIQSISPLGNFIAEGTGGFPIEIKSNLV